MIVHYRWQQRGVARWRLGCASLAMGLAKGNIQHCSQTLPFRERHAILIRRHPCNMQRERMGQEAGNGAWGLTVH